MNLTSASPETDGDRECATSPRSVGTGESERVRETAVVSRAGPGTLRSGAGQVTTIDAEDAHWTHTETTGSEAV